MQGGKELRQDQDHTMQAGRKELRQDQDHTVQLQPAKELLAKTVF